VAAETAQELKEMFITRPIRSTDLEPLLELAGQTGFGLTSLPRDRALLSKRIQKSLRSFEDKPDAPGGEFYLFVLEDTSTGRPVGTAGISSKVGGFEPLYSYRIEKAMHQSASLNVRKEVPVLHLEMEHSGPSELCSLFLAPDFRRDGNGRLLSLCRMLFMAEHSKAFDPKVIAEIRGVINDQGRSPFWDALGKHFFEVDFPRADHLSAVNKRFIGELMPRHPIYVFLLPDAAQQVIGQPHPDSRSAMGLLEGEGFAYTGTVDIFDAGPIVSCPLREIRSVRESRRATVAAIADAVSSTDPLLIATTGREFRACQSPGDVSENGIVLSRHAAAALNLSAGDQVRYVRARPSGYAPAAPTGL
jgi:arginine N-succinyltransferase